MLDIRFIRENSDLVALAAKKKRVDFDVKALIELDDKRKAHLASIEKKRAEQNAVSEKMPTATEEEKASLLQSMKKVKESLVREEGKYKDVLKEWQKLMLYVPNIPDFTVPEGETDEQNKELRTWGDKPNLSFKPKDHIELMEKAGLVDFERGVKVSGFRGYFLKNDGAQLSMALWNFVVDKMREKGFELIIAPSKVRSAPLVGTAMLPQTEEDLYKVGEQDYLAGTGEVATMGLHMDEVLDQASLPKKYVAFSPCFRAEAGNHGKDVNGLIRVHEFYKMEQVILCEANHETSVRFHEELTANAEEIVQALGLHYRVVVNCGGDLGLGQVKKYDIEVYMPSHDNYRETHSSSYFHDFQTRRLNIRYKDVEGKMRFAHSLNNTAVATPRMLACIVENYQQEDGSIVIPEVLRKYMGGREKLV